MRNIFLEKSYTKCGEEASPEPFYKDSKLNISLDQMSEILYSFFFVFPSRCPLKCINTEVPTTCLYLIYKVFLEVS